MKYIIVIFLLSIWLNGCKDCEELICDTPILGSFKTETNYNGWINSSCYYTLLNDTSFITLKFSSLDEYCNLVEFEISNVKLKVDKYFYKHGINLIEYTGEDGILGLYNLDTNFVNELSILKINRAKNEVSGKFNLLFLPDIKLPPKYNDIYFKNSTFTANLLQ